MHLHRIGLSRLTGVGALMCAALLFACVGWGCSSSPPTTIAPSEITFLRASVAPAPAPTASDPAPKADQVEPTPATKPQACHYLERAFAVATIGLQPYPGDRAKPKPAADPPDRLVANQPLSLTPPATAPDSATDASMRGMWVDTPEGRIFVPPGGSYERWSTRGAAITSPSADAALKASMGAPELDIPDAGSGKGAALTIDAKALLKPTSMTLLYAMGGVAVLGGIALAVLARDHWKGGVSIAAGGVGLIILARAVETQPVLLWLGAIVFVGLLVYAAWLAYRAQVGTTFARAEAGALSQIGTLKIADGPYAGKTIGDTVRGLTDRGASQVNRRSAVKRLAKAANQKAITTKAE